jgi:ABC-type dipeptide/oligopeptide/nickel transport system permease component
MNNIIIILLVVITVLVIMTFALINLKFSFLYDKLEYMQREQRNHDELLQILKETFDLNQSTLQQYKDFLEFIKEGENNNSDRYIKILELMNDLTQIIPNQITDLQNELNKEQNNKDNE